MTRRDMKRELALAREGLTPSTTLRDRVRSGLVASGAATRGASALVLAELLRSHSPWEALRSSGRIGLMVGAGLLALGAGSGYWLRSARDEPPPLPRAPVMVDVAEVTLVPEAVPLEAVPLESPAAEGSKPDRSKRPPPARQRSLAQASAPEPAPPAPASNDEMVLLQRAERAVRGDHPALALALTAELDDRFPRSPLLQERRAIALLARCKAGEHDVASQAAGFLRAYPKSVYASRIRELCLNQPASIGRAPEDRASNALPSSAPAANEQTSNERVEP